MGNVASINIPRGRDWLALRPEQHLSNLRNNPIWTLDSCSDIQSRSKFNKLHPQMVVGVYKFYVENKDEHKQWWKKIQNQVVKGKRPCQQLTVLPFSGVKFSLSMFSKTQNKYLCFFENEKKKIFCLFRSTTQVLWPICSSVLGWGPCEQNFSALALTLMLFQSTNRKWVDWTSINISATAPNLYHFSSNKTYACIDLLHTRQKKNHMLILAKNYR